MNMLKKLFSSDNIKSKNEYLDYLDLDKFEKDIDSNFVINKKYVKIVIFSNSNQIQTLKQEIYNGNLLIVDISSIKSDERLRKQFLNELKEVIIDINGDIVGIKENLIVITPKGIEIDRIKIGVTY